MSDDEYDYEPIHDLSVLHRWELLHMIWEPFALGASGRVLSVLFRVLPPGRPLFMSMSAVAREAAVIKRTVSRTYKELRAGGIMVTAENGRPTIDYATALDAAIRSIASRPAAERERRLARLHEIAAALGRSINMDRFAKRTSQLDGEPGKKLAGRRTRKPQQTQKMGRGHVVPGSGSRCHPELNTNGNPNLNPELNINDPSRDDAARRSSGHDDGRVQKTRKRRLSSSPASRRSGSGPPSSSTTSARRSAASW
jgi:DNA-binding transcriptional regulator YhcF (GntR family)